MVSTAVTNQNNLNGGNLNMNETVKPKVQIDTEVFSSTTKSKLTTTLDLAGEINQIFRPIFADYEGCTLMPDNMGNLQATLYFKDKGAITDPADKRIKNLESAVAPTKGASPIDKINALNARNRNKAYTLTEETKQVLEEFILKRSRDGKVNWKEITAEVTEQSHYGYQIYVKVSGIDIISILRAKYGNKSEGEKGSPVQYAILFNKPLSPMPGVAATNYLITITQLDVREVETLCKNVGMMPVQGNIPIIR